MKMVRRAGCCSRPATSSSETICSSPIWQITSRATTSPRRTSRVGRSRGFACRALTRIRGRSAGHWPERAGQCPPRHNKNSSTHRHAKRGWARSIEGRQIMMMNRRSYLTAMAAGAAASLISTRGMANPAPMRARNVVLVHGLFADGSCWSEVIQRLQAVGLNATAVQNPLTTLPDAVAAAQRVLARQDGPTVLVGHSFAGMIVTEAGMHPNVSALVYVAARAPDADEDYTALAKTFPTPPASAGIVFDGDEGRLSEAAFLHDFAGDLPQVKAKALYAVQEPFRKALLAGKTMHAAWRSKPSFYAVSTEDRTIDPDLERFMAKRMGAKTVEVKASHLSLISQPDTITNLILEAAGQPA